MIDVLSKEAVEFALRAIEPGFPATAEVLREHESALRADRDGLEDAITSAALSLGAAAKLAKAGDLKSAWSIIASACEALGKGMRGSVRADTQAEPVPDASALHEDDLRALVDGLRNGAMMVELAIEDLRNGRPYEDEYAAGVERAFEALRDVGRDPEKAPQHAESVAP